MKNIFVLLLCCIALNSFAQHPFIRVYNAKGKKFLKGRLENTSDSGIVVIKEGKESEGIKYTNIYKLRLRKSAGMTALIAGGIPVIWGASLINRNQNWDGLVGILVIMEGMIIGPTAGGIKALLNPKPLLVEGNHQKWMEVKLKLDQKLSK